MPSLRFVPLNNVGVGLDDFFHDDVLEVRHPINGVLCLGCLQSFANERIGSVYLDQVVATNNVQYPGFVRAREIRQLALCHVEVFIWVGGEFLGQVLVSFVPMPSAVISMVCCKSSKSIFTIWGISGEGIFNLFAIG